MHLHTESSLFRFFELSLYSQLSFPFSHPSEVVFLLNLRRFRNIHSWGGEQLVSAEHSEGGKKAEPVLCRAAAAQALPLVPSPALQEQENKAKNAQKWSENAAASQTAGRVLHTRVMGAHKCIKLPIKFLLTHSRQELYPSSPKTQCNCGQFFFET